MANQPAASHARVFETDRTSKWSRMLLLVPFLAVLGAPEAEPAPVLFGVACPYWYQLVWAVIAAGLIYAVSRIERRSP